MTISGGNDHGVVICASGYLYTWGVNKDDKGQKSNLLGLAPDNPKVNAAYVDKPEPVNVSSSAFT